MRFHSLDGIDWTDREAKKAHYVGTAINDFVEGARKGVRMPVRSEPVERVIGSSALLMADSLYIPALHSIANNGSPIVINNACLSWHRLSVTFMFAGARAYIGTLYPVLTSESEAMALALLGKHFGKMLPHAIWAAQNAAYGPADDRRPYVVTGVYTQRLRATAEDVPLRILTELNRGEAGWKRVFRSKIEDEQDRRRQETVQAYYDREIPAFRQRWFPEPGGR